MNALLVFVLAVSAANASIIAGPSVWAGPSEALLRGPAVQSTVVGPDGSSISAAADSGALAASAVPGAAVIGAPEVIASRTIIGAPGIIANPWGLGRAGIVGSAGIIAPGVNAWGRSLWW
ncbi:hypothetical protein FQR65_LT02454 [Abscondita terminalis]|nr:hypothetical protein FQR65_LT02454 [Abscondita terminalis]